MLDAVREHYERHNANVARSVHTLGTEATEAYEGARREGGRVHRRAARPTRSCSRRTPPRRSTWSRTRSPTPAADPTADPRFRLGPGDEIVISEMEHHSNIVPWQLLCERTGATLRWFGITDQGRLDESTLDELINERTKLVSLVLVSNILGTVNATVADHRTGSARSARCCMLDASQSVPHLPVDVVDYDADFLAFTGHKMLGPTGIGVLWGRGELLAAMPPVPRRRLDDRDGDDGAARRSPPPPARFEAGTPPIARGGRARRGGRLPDRASAWTPSPWHEKELTAYALEALATVPGLRIFGPTDPVGRGGTISFDLDGVHPHDVGPGPRRAGRAGPGRPPLRPADLRPVRRAGDDAAPRSTCTPPRRRSTPWWRRWRKVRKVFA